MTKVTVFKNGEKYTKISCIGHAGFGVEGEDIVCSALSSIVNTAALGFTAVACANVKLVRDEKTPLIEIEIPATLPSDVAHDVQVIFATMMCGISDLHSEYSDFIELEVKNVLY